jgi:hypothetical protein
MSDAKHPAAPGQSADVFVPDPQVWAEFGITAMSGSRWTNDPDLNFPPAIKIRGRNFRSRKQIEEFKARMIAVAVTNRNAA